MGMVVPMQAVHQIRMANLHPQYSKPTAKTKRKIECIGLLGGVREKERERENGMTEVMDCVRLAYIGELSGFADVRKQIHVTAGIDFRLIDARL